MTKFLDGPAMGAFLSLKRAPMFLRVVRGRGFDALDQPDDTPAAHEELSAYVREGEASDIHINRGRKGSGFYKVAQYRYIEQQPDDATMRDNQKWQEWCQSKAGATSL